MSKQEEQRAIVLGQVVAGPLRIGDAGTLMPCTRDLKSRLVVVGTLISI